MSKILKLPSILIILFLAFVLRLISIEQSLWLDEAINVVYAKQEGFWWFVTQYSIGDFHPPGWFVVLWIWIASFGASEFSVRFPAVIFGVLVVLITYLIGRRLFSTKVGIIAALMLAVAPLHIYYSQEARMYSFATFAVTLSVYALIKLLNNDRFSIITYALSLTLLLYSDYVAYFAIPAQVLYVLLFYRSKIKSLFLGLFLSLLFFSPWLWIFPEQLAHGNQTRNIVIGWANVVGGTDIKNLLLLPTKIFIGRTTFENKFFYSIIVLIIALLYAYLLFKGSQHRDKKLYLLVFLLGIPILTGYLISFIIPIFSYFRFLYVLPFLYLMLSFGASKLTGGYRKLAICLVIFFEVFFTMYYLFNNQFHREDWKTSVKYVNDNLRIGDVVVFEDNVELAPYTFYDKKNSGTPGLKRVPAQSESDTTDILNDAVIERIFLFEYLVDITDPKRMLERRILQLGFDHKETFDYRGVGFIKLYERPMTEQ